MLLINKLYFLFINVIFFDAIEMKGVTLLSFVLLLVVYPLYITNMTIVLQNLVFTRNDFTVSSVPFYDVSLGEGTTKWYRYHWWEYATDVLRIVPTLLSFVSISLGISFKIKYVGPYIGITAVLLAVEFLKLLKRGVDFVRCGSFQLCRSYNSIAIESPSSANPIFITSTFLTLGFVIILPIYIVVFGYIESSLEDFIEKQNLMKYGNSDLLPNYKTSGSDDEESSISYQKSRLGSGINSRGRKEKKGEKETKEQKRSKSSSSKLKSKK